MRDKYESEAFFSRRLAVSAPYNEEKDYLQMFRDKVASGPPGVAPSTAALTTGHAEGYMRDVALMYARGDSLDAIKAARVDPGLLRYVDAARELERYNGEFPDHSTYFWGCTGAPHNLHSVYTLLCWLICFGADPEQIGQVAPLLAPAGVDRLLDLVLRRYQPDRVIASGSGDPATFDLLDAAIDAPADDRAGLLERYLASWGVRMSNLKGLNSLGIASPTKKIKTNAALIKSIGDMHQGLWAWEVALVAKVFAVDDARFKDNEFYPHDLVHFTD